MSKVKKLLQKAINNPRGLSYKDFITLLSNNGWSKVRHDRGSHEYWVYGENGPVVPIQNSNGKAKEYEVKQVLRILQGDANEST